MKWLDMPANEAAKQCILSTIASSNRSILRCNFVATKCRMICASFSLLQKIQANSTAAETVLIGDKGGVFLIAILAA
jgi:hypothetical protein